MSTDPSAAALGPDNAAADASASPAPAEAPNDLADLAAAIERLEALIANDTAPGPDGSAAVERIADIAFVLHEREVEASLCDALDAAVREISDSGLLKSAGTQRTQEAGELLRDLSRRVSDLMARKQAEEGADVSAAARTPRRAASRFDDEDMATDEEIAAELFATDLPEDDEFARVVAGLAGSLPVRADEEPEPGPPPDAAIAAQLPDEPSDPPPQYSGDTRSAESEGVVTSVAVVEMALVVESGDAVVLGRVSGEFSGESAALPNVAAGEPPAERSSGEVTAAEELREQAPDELLSAALPSPLAVAEAPTAEEISNEIAATETASNETSSNEPAPTEPLPSVELAVDSAAAALNEDSANVSALALPVPDVIAPPDVMAPTNVDENLSPAPPQPSTIATSEPQSPAAAPAAEASAAPLSDRGPVPHDDQSAAELLTTSEPVQKSPVETINPPAVAENADEIFAPVEPTSAEPEPVQPEPVQPKPIESKPVESKPSRTALPDVSIDPDEDPGDLFEPVAVATAKPLTVSGVATSVAAAPAPSNVAAKAEKTPAAASNSEQKPVQSAQPATSAPGIPVSAPSSAKPDAKPQAQPASPRAASAAPQAAPRPGPADPLAPVRALSEEEMIALFS